MKFINFVLLTILVAAVAACDTTTSDPAVVEEKPDTAAEKKEEVKPEADAGSPSDAVRNFVKAHQEKNVDELKKYFSKRTLEGMEEDAKRADKTLDDMLRKFVEEPLPFKGVPEIRNEKIDGDRATLEVNAEGQWEETELVREDGRWKLDFGEGS